MVFFEIVALHSCQLRIRLKHLVTIVTLINFVVKVQLSSLQQYEERKLLVCAFQEFLQKKSKHLLSTTLFVDCFCYNERITEKESKVFASYRFDQHCFFDESKDKRKWFSLKSVRSEGPKWKIQHLLKLKTHLVSFIFGFRYQVSGKNKNKRFRSMVVFQPVKSASAVLSV